MRPYGSGGEGRDPFLYLKDCDIAHEFLQVSPMYICRLQVREWTCETTISHKWHNTPSIDLNALRDYFVLVFVLLYCIVSGSLANGTRLVLFIPLRDVVSSIEAAFESNSNNYVLDSCIPYFLENYR